MPRLQWSSLNTQQVGTFFEYFMKMELTMFGFEVFTSEVDDRGIDFIARRPGGRFLEVQAKALRAPGYVFLRKAHFKPSETRYVALGMLLEGKAPNAYLIPSTVWESPNQIFVSRDYDKPDQTSEPEWGINVSAKNLLELQQFALEPMLDQLATSKRFSVD